MYRFPAASTTSPRGLCNCAAFACPPSLHAAVVVAHEAPLPATDEIAPGVNDTSGPAPLPAINSVAITVPPVVVNSTAPIRCPGNAGVNVAFTVQLAPAA